MGESGEIMKQFWEDHSKHGSVKEMMLDENAEAFSDLEKAELLSILPTSPNWDILEIGAGIGRFTGDLAPQCKSILAVDFMEKFIELNREANEHFGNTSFLQADVNDLELNEDSFNVVFTNWLMMYLTNDEVKKLARNALTWLREDGYFFFRESCFHQSGNKKRGFNPTEYRDPTEYNNLILTESIQDTDGSFWQFELISMQSVKTYIEVKGNCNQICWLMRKVRCDMPPRNNLDLSLTRNNILQWVCGENYTVTGGNAITKLLMPHLNLELNSNILDFGTGLGGGAFYIAEKLDATIRAVGDSPDAITSAVKSAHDLKEKRVAFEVTTDTVFAHENDALDGVICHDHLNKVKGKSSLLRVFKNGLKAGKRLVLADICHTTESSDEEWLEETVIGPYTITMARYQEILRSAGMTVLEAMDLTDVYMQHLKQEYNRLMTQIHSFLHHYTMEQYKDIQAEWYRKIQLFENGSLRWVVFVAEKSTENGIIAEGAKKC